MRLQATFPVLPDGKLQSPPMSGKSIKTIVDRNSITDRVAFVSYIRHKDFLRPDSSSVRHAQGTP